MNKLLVLAGVVLLIIVGFKAIATPNTPIVSPAPSPRPNWGIMSIDTMKYSRDIAREKLADDSFDNVIETQVKNIAATGATHIALATPYDEEFVPFLTRWVDSARSHGLKVWFRGNFSGWEKWFDHDQMTREEHVAATKAYIKANPDLFEDGDLFTPCPECENGGPGDPRLTRDFEGHRRFLIATHNAATQAFWEIGKKVSVGYHSMNYDVALAIMDRPTTAALGGVVTIDHYVKSPSQLNADINKIAELSGGKVFLGEYGAPIPDIHGMLSQEEQAKWLEESLSLLKNNQSLIGLSYWVSVGGSTKLWDEDGTARSAVSTLTKYYSQRQ
jgi:hypothetical protein